MDDQIELLSWHRPGPSRDDLRAVLDVLHGGEWLTAVELCARLGLPGTESNRRRLRLVADGSQGRIASGQKGYKLTSALSAGEFQHARTWLLSQAREMQRRVLELDKVFYARQPVPALA